MTTHDAAAELPVVVIGAGPIGLAAAAHLVDRGLNPLVLEAGDAPGAAVRDWAHVRLFSTWDEVIDPAAEKLLAANGWQRPDGTAYPTAAEEEGGSCCGAPETLHVETIPPAARPVGS